MAVKLNFTTPVTVYSPSVAGEDVLLTYPRIVELTHSGEHNGTLLAIGETLEVPFYKVFRSTDGGETWNYISEVKEQLDPELISNWQPHIYELPCDLGELPAGTLLASGCTRDKRVQEVTKMCVWKSCDIGETWEEISVVDVGGRIDHGMYEPFLICDEDGTLVCFYSDETEVDDVHGQRLIFRTSKDGINWGEKKYVLAPKERRLRPGMITVAKADNGKYIAAYEMVAMPGHPVYVKISDSLTDWGDPEDFGLLVKSTDGKILSSTPCCEWNPYGDSADGAIIVTGWRNVDGTSKTGSDLFISLDMGKTWEALDNPLPYEFPAKHRYGYSPALLTSADKKSVFYMNSVPWEGNTQDRVRGKYAFTKLTLE